MSNQQTILQEADKLINGDRRQAYGPAVQSFGRIAQVWSGVLGHPITPQQVALCMIGLKACREANKPGRDNRVDLCGYAALLDLIEGAPK